MLRCVRDSLQRTEAYASAHQFFARPAFEIFRSACIPEVSIELLYRLGRAVISGANLSGFAPAIIESLSVAWPTAGVLKPLYEKTRPVVLSFVGF